MIEPIERKTPYVRHYASVVIRDAKGNFLSVFHSQKSEHQWRFPGGKIDDREVPLQAAARELKEELCITANSLCFVTEYMTRVDGGLWVGHFFLLGHPVAYMQNMEPDKHSEIRYLTVDELKQFDSHPEYEVAKMFSGNRL